MASKALVAPTKKAIRVAPVRPNIGIERAYQKQLDALIAAMQRDIMRTITRNYKENPPELAQDASPAMQFRDAIADLSDKWESRFDEFAEEKSRRFGKQTTAQASRSFAAGLRKAGFTVEFKMTKAVNDVMQASIGEQVNLIRSIPAQHFKNIEGSVMRSVQTGRDLHSLQQDLMHDYGVTARRAAFIARDQNNKATATITRARQEELGITQAEWLHSRGGKVPRPSHVAFSGKRYDIDKGAFLDGVWTWPGVEINCRCVSCSVIPGLD